MDTKCKYFPEDSEEFPWDEKALDIFKRKIDENKISCRTDDIFLLGFLRAKNYDQESALQLLVNYYNTRCNYTIMFNDLLPSKLENALSLNTLQFMPKPDQDGRYISIVQSGDWDPSVGSITEFFRVYLLFADFQINFHRTQENQTVLILNSDGLTLRHLLQYNPIEMNYIITILYRNVYQLCVKEMHIVNINKWMKAILSITLPLFPSKVRKQLFFHENVKTLHKFVQPQYLPAEFGGELPNFDPTEAVKIIRENEAFFQMNEQYVKKYKEDLHKKFIEERFGSSNSHDEELKQELKTAEEKFKSLEADTENYLSNLESVSNVEINYFK